MSKNLFNSIQLTKPKRSAFDLTHDVKLTCNLGTLVPVMQLECVPGDKVKLGCESLVRFSPLLAPVMHRLDMSIHYFFVPYRILWDGWEKFIVNDSTNGLPAFPYFNVYPNDFDAGLPDYMGIPRPDDAQFHNVSAMPFAAYQKIYSEYYRDQNLIAEPNYKLNDGNNSTNDDLITLRRRAWEHDYFTAALPWAQKGQEVTLPLGNIQIDDVGVYRNTPTSGDNTTLTGNPESVNVTGRTSTNPAIGIDQLYANTVDTVPVDSVTINELRRAFRLQEWLERNARAGTRYVENILAHFGVRSSDKRLQRPEYITGVKSPVVVSEVLSTFQSTDVVNTDNLPQGNMSGHAVSIAQGNHGSYYCEEHGIIIGIMSVMPKPAYMDGIAKMWLKRDPLEYYWPSFAHLGEQPVENREVYAKHSNPTGTFGYVPRYAEYKFEFSRVAGDFRSNLSYWHFARKFANDPALNVDFVECNPENRPFAVVDGTDVLYCHVLNKVLAIRPMPKFGTPMI